MKVIRFQGGLGNQMFQYGAYQAFMQKGQKVVGSIGYYDQHSNMGRFLLKETFPGIEIEICDDSVFFNYYSQYTEEKKSKWACFRNKYCYWTRVFWIEERPFIYDERIFRTKNCVYIGYWQTEQYFKQYRDIMLSNFTFAYGEARLQELAGEFSARNTVSVHIRRGDYLTFSDRYGGICTREYYEKAIAYIEDKVENASFIFFSDDKKWVQDEFMIKGISGKIITESMFVKYEDWYDMYLMTACAHNIIANSSFSWWGAWLNQSPGKIVIAPAGWLNDKPVGNICPEEWIRF